MRKLSGKIEGFRSDENGAGTAWSIFWTVIFLICAGLLIDTANAYRFKAALRSTSDSAALAGVQTYFEKKTYTTALQTADPGDPTVRAQNAAQFVARKIMAVDDGNGNQKNGEVVQHANVVPGWWNGSEFSTGGTKVNAVKVTSLRTAANGNQVGTFLLDAFGGLTNWDVGATSVAAKMEAECFQKQGIMAGGSLNFTSNNTFWGDLCLHGEDRVSINQNNVFEPIDGVYPGVSYGVGGDVCMGSSPSPAGGRCQTEGSGYTYVVDPISEGLTEDAIMANVTWFPDVNRMYADIESAINDPLAASTDMNLSKYVPKPLVFSKNDNGTVSLITQPDPFGYKGPGSARSENGVTKVTMSKTQFETVMSAANGTGVSPLPQGIIYEITTGCGQGNNHISLAVDVLIENVVIKTGCRLTIGSGTKIASSVIFTSYNGNNHAFSGTSGAQVGMGTCLDASRGTKLIAAGDVNMAAGLAINGSQIITKRNAHVAAQADGMKGTMVIAGGDAFFTANSSFQACPDGVVTDHYIPNMFRLVM